MNPFDLWLSAVIASLEWWLSLARSFDHRSAMIGHDIGKRRLKLVHSR
jgi:hypothetical protein